MTVVILGCGYTGERIAQRLLAREVHVIATSRKAERLRSLAQAGAQIRSLDILRPFDLDFIPPNSLILHSIPVLQENDELREQTPALIQALEGRRARRLVYISSTGVYGQTREVNAETLVAPVTPREHLRVEAERAIGAASFPTLSLRAAAIYGPGRGIQESLRRGTYRLAGDGSNWVSRIHVDDLAALCDAALSSDLTGAYPVADEHACPAREIAEYCAELLGLRLPAPVSAELLHETRQADRRVDGRSIFAVLERKLQYPTYRTGVPASLP